jgi:hypothetical protein
MPLIFTTAGRRQGHSVPLRTWHVPNSDITLLKRSSFLDKASRGLRELSHARVQPASSGSMILPNRKYDLLRETAARGDVPGADLPFWSKPF